MVSSNMAGMCVGVVCECCVSATWGGGGGGGFGERSKRWQQRCYWCGVSIGSDISRSCHLPASPA